MKTKDNHKVKVFDMPDDYEGKVIVTLVSLPASEISTSAILYIHGYQDYYFQYHMGEYFADRGKNFYSVDLRKYGRSYRPEQHFNYCRNMSEYYADIDSALDEIIADGNTDITLIGHSTGGLLAALYGSQGSRRGFVNRIILNSPFLEFNMNWAVRKLVIPVAGLVGRLFPYTHIKSPLSLNYFDSIHSSARGEWDFDKSVKPRTGAPLYLAWMRAIRMGHKKVKRGLHIPVPVLVMFSDKSTYHRDWHEEARESDTILNVKHIMKYGAILGDNVQLEEIEGGLHDLVLSRKDVREKVLNIMDYFIGKR